MDARVLEDFLVHDLILTRLVKSERLKLYLERHDQ